MKTLFAAILAVALTGCGTAKLEQQKSQIDALSQQVAEMQKADADQRKYIAGLLAAKKATPTAAAEPAIPATATVPAVGSATSIVYQEPAGYQCYVGEANPGFGGGHWVKIQNFNPKYDLAMTMNGKWGQGGTKIVIMVPRPGSSGRRDLASWVPYYVGPQGVTALPAMTSCHLWIPSRLNDDGTVKDFKLFADAYQPSLVPVGNTVAKRWTKASVLRRPREFTLYGQMETVVSLQWYNFI